MTTPAPPVRYLPDFLDPHLAADLFDDLQHSIPWEQRSLTLYGRTRLVPRLTCWFGEIAYTYSGITNTPHLWTSELARLRAEVEDETGAHFNSCLANLYRDGSDGVGWHADNERELGPAPTIASVSLGSTRTFRFRHVRSRATCDFELSAGSLLVMHGDCQAEWLHSVPKRAHVDGPRINLTYRWFKETT